MTKETFSTQSEAERRIAELGLIGKMKAQRLGTWRMVKNNTGAVTRSQFVAAYKHQCRLEGRNMRDIVKINIEAHTAFDVLLESLNRRPK